MRTEGIGVMRETYNWTKAQSTGVPETRGESSNDEVPEKRPRMSIATQKSLHPVKPAEYELYFSKPIYYFFFTYSVLSTYK